MFGIPYEYIFYVHIASLCLAAGGIVAADKLGLSWFRGDVETLSAKTLCILHEVVNIALSLIIASGLLLFWPQRGYLVGQPLFYVKMLFVAALLANSFIIDRLMHVAALRPFIALSPKHKAALVGSGIVSLACWAGAALTALVLFGFFS